MSYDVLIIGAGPAGMACALEAKKLGLNYAMIDKGCLVNSVYHFPADMTFFSTPELLSVGDMVFVSNSFRPNRVEALNYYRAVFNHYKLNLISFENVTSISKNDQRFTVKTTHKSGVSKSYEADKVIVATGYYDQPNKLNIPGEELDKVSHYYTEAHPYNGLNVAIIGAKNSAVEAALNYQRAGAKVTLIHRGDGISSSVKYWVRPDIDKKLESGAIETRFNSRVIEVTEESITIENSKTGEQEILPNDFLFALTGYRPDVDLLSSAGVEIDAETLAPIYDNDTLETNVKGLYVAGSIAAGINNNKIFIENSRSHGKLVFS